jgi:membrane-associated phospholipid phosphatase
MYNSYFMLPFMAWMIIGCFLYAAYPSQYLFQSVNSWYSDWANTLFYYVTYMGQGQVIVPVLVLLMVFRRFRSWWYLILAGTCNLVPFFVDQLLKFFFNNPRPMAVYYLPTWPAQFERSFPSGHSAGAFSFFCFLSLLLPPRFRAFGLLFFLLALSVCYSRMYLAAHFFEDVYTGSLLGCMLTVVLFSVMNNYKTILLKERLQPTSLS